MIIRKMVAIALCLYTTMHCTLLFFIVLQHPLYIVVDTSAILAHLEMVAKYIENPIEGVGYPVFLFPWKVLQELDTLYEHVDSRILECVKKAVEFLQNAITSKHSRVLFQLFDEVNTSF